MQEYGKEIKSDKKKNETAGNILFLIFNIFSSFFWNHSPFMLKIFGQKVVMELLN